MKTEPDWIDVIALVAMHSFLQTAPKNARYDEIAFEAYRQAEQMMRAREEFNSEGESDE